MAGEAARPQSGGDAVAPETTSWTSDELTRIGSAEELQIASPRDDGTMRPYVTIWVVALPALSMAFTVNV